MTLLPEMTFDVHLHDLSKRDPDYETEFVLTLCDEIRSRGAMETLISDSAKVEISKKVVDVLRTYAIKNHQSEPHHQHQNYAEHVWRTIKQLAKNFMNRTGATASYWIPAAVQYSAIFIWTRTVWHPAVITWPIDSPYAWQYSLARYTI